MTIDSAQLNSIRQRLRFIESQITITKTLHDAAIQTDEWLHGVQRLSNGFLGSCGVPVCPQTVLYEAGVPTFWASAFFTDSEPTENRDSGHRGFVGRVQLLVRVFDEVLAQYISGNRVTQDLTTPVAVSASVLHANTSTIYERGRIQKKIALWSVSKRSISV